MISRAAIKARARHPGEDLLTLEPGLLDLAPSTTSLESPVASEPDVAAAVGPDYAARWMTSSVA